VNGEWKSARSRREADGGGLDVEFVDVGFRGVRRGSADGHSPVVNVTARGFATSAVEITREQDFSRSVVFLNRRGH
jgi:hypothetical protein